MNIYAAFLLQKPPQIDSLQCVKIRAVSFCWMFLLFFPTQTLTQPIQNTLSGFSKFFLSRTEKHDEGKGKSSCLFFEVSLDKGARVYDRVQERDGVRKRGCKEKWGRSKLQAGWQPGGFSITLQPCMELERSREVPCRVAPMTGPGRGVVTPLSMQRKRH